MTASELTGITEAGEGLWARFYIGCKPVIITISELERILRSHFFWLLGNQGLIQGLLDEEGSGKDPICEEGLLGFEVVGDSGPGHMSICLFIFSFASRANDRESVLGAPATFTPLPMEQRSSYMTAQKK